MDDSIEEVFDRAGCIGALHVTRISDRAEVALRADEAWLAASVIKVPIGLEFYAQADQGQLDEKSPVTLDPARKTPGPTGISLAADPVTMSLRDLCTAMLTISDNAATDALLDKVTREAVNERLIRLGCANTILVESLAEMLDAIGRHMGFADYVTLLRAQRGELGVAAQVASTDQARLGSCRVLDPARASRTTARDMTRLITAIWTDQAASPRACAELRATMSRQLTRRLGGAVPPNGALAAKSGALLGRVRNEVGAIATAAGETYAVAVLTRPVQPPALVAETDGAMGRAVKAAIEQLEDVSPEPGR